jgi:outer membrane cobalamin receptor
MRPGRQCLVVVCALAAAVSRASASTRDPCADATAQMWTRSEVASDRAAWQKPLDRVVAFDLGDMTLGRALDRVASQSGVHFSYSPDLVPVQRAVCLSVGQRPLGGLLVALLAGTNVSPVVVGADQIVLAPNRSAAGSDASPVAARPTRVLERVVVTGTSTGAPERGSPFSISRVDRSSLTTTGNTSLSMLMDAAMPGIWAWAQSPVNALARYGSIRGASSFGVSTPKIYIDGIEVANPLLLTTLDPAQIDYVEVIRGPQGAALYGSDAISGVVNIQMRHDGGDGNGAATDARASAGSAASDYVAGGVLAQEYGATVRSGSPARSMSTSLSLSRIGEFTPGASATQALASAGTRYVGSRVIVTGTGRFEATNAQSPTSPILLAYHPTPAGSSDSTQRVRQYTLGGTATLQQNDDWMHAATLGIDGYRLAGTAGDATPLPSVADSALAAARGGADRITIRLSSNRQLGGNARDPSSIGFGLEHSSARESSSGLGSILAPRIEGQGEKGSALVARRDLQAAQTHATTSSWWNNTGVYSQAHLALTPALSLTGGARVEHMSGPSENGRLAFLPMLGAAWIGETGDITLKARAAYGRGIRPARTVARGASFSGGRGPGTLTSLAPEEQAGVEAGVDLLFGSVMGLHVTRFDQRASGLVQPVAILGLNSSGTNRAGEPESARVLYQLQNVGAINNSGWELQGTSLFGALSLGASLSFVDSRVANLAAGYLGDLHTGDRLLEVPARTASLQARWTRSRLSLSGSVARASDWINYDEVALAQAVAADATGRLVPVGEALRAYWRTYEGSTRLGATASFRVTERASLSLTGSNLLNHQLGEPDNITVVPGRSILFGMQTTF